MPFFYYLSFIILGSCLSLTTALAEPVRFSSPDQAVAYALANQPDLQALRESVAEAEARASQAGRLTNPVIGLESAGGRDFEGRIEGRFTQPLPLNNRLALEKQRARYEVAFARLIVAEEARQLALQVRLTILEQSHSIETQQLMQQRAALARDWLNALERSVQEGAESPLTLSKQKLVTQELQLDAANFEAEIIAAQSRLARLLGLPPGSTISIPHSHSLVPVPAKRAIVSRPQLQLAELAVEAADMDVALASATRWDDIVLGIFWETARIPGDEKVENEFLAGLRVSIPLPLWQDGRPEIQEQQASEKRARRELQAVRANIEHEVAAAHAIMVRRHQAATRVENELRPATKKQLAQIEAAYQRGEVDWEAVFTARMELALLRSRQLRQNELYYQARLQWLHTIGALQPATSHPYQKP